MTESRKIVVVDVETSALRPRDERLSMLGRPTAPYGVAVEVAWWDSSTGDAGRFVPQHNVEWVRSLGAPEALVVSRYLERLVDAEQDDGTEVAALHARLDGATLAGSNPAFDAAFLAEMFKRLPGKPGPGRGVTRPKPDPWHHRLLDLSAYYAGVRGMPGGALLGLAAICEHLEVDAPDHTAMGDVQATVACLSKIGVLPVDAS